ncbi:MAG TPA: helix-turn-helix domain-containing protein [Silvibacterium sp.]|nr:helix-turn-helix domain-containing protein [Silvibacterium sp.]
MVSQEKKSIEKGTTKRVAVRIKTPKGAAKSYRSAAFAAIHEAAEGLHKAGMIDNTTMREFDQECLTPIIKLSPNAIRKIRIKAAISQSVFAAHLNVTTGVVSKWERGEKQPRGPAAKLLSLAAKRGIAAIA